MPRWPPWGTLLTFGALQVGGDPETITVSERPTVQRGLRLADATLCAYAKPPTTGKLIALHSQKTRDCVFWWNTISWGLAPSLDALTDPF